MSGFKLLAIRPLKDCNPLFLKNLKEDILYQFYWDYSFVFADGDKSQRVVEIEYQPSLPDTFFGYDGLPINISAVVGKNGSGKSSLIELLYAAVYNLSVETGVLREVENEDDRIELLTLLEDLYVEVFYYMNNSVYSLTISNFSDSCCLVMKYKEEKQDDRFIFTQPTEQKLSEESEFVDLGKMFFYSIGINYSLYGMNSKQIGIWIRSLFHKNDGYRTPVVISPYRNAGNIDVNREADLAKQRLLSNLISPYNKDIENNELYLTDYQKVESLSFWINTKKIHYAFVRRGEQISFDSLYLTDPKDRVMSYIYEAYFEGKKPPQNIKFKDQVESYIIKKIIQIARGYEEYRQFFHEDLDQSPGVLGSTETLTIELGSHFPNLKEYVRRLKKNDSHVTFKLRQAINYLMHGILESDLSRGFSWEFVENETGEKHEVIKITPNALSEKIKEILTKNRKVIELIPPPIFDFELHLKSTDGKDSLFSALSSGEQQLIQSVQGIVYHALNLDSVFLTERDLERSKFENLNIILDEVELYFHPEFQRKFIKYLVDALQRAGLEYSKNINALFITHSPFILSDIPSENILKLNEGHPCRFADDEQTFGANIHKLLANDFFLANGFIGKFAMQKITEVIGFLNERIQHEEISQMIDKMQIEYETKKMTFETRKEALKIQENIKELKKKRNQFADSSLYSKRDDYWSIVNLIGEPVIREKLLDMYARAFPNHLKEMNFEKELVRLKAKYGKQ